MGTAGDTRKIEEVALDTVICNIVKTRYFFLELGLGVLKNMPALPVTLAVTQFHNHVSLFFSNHEFSRLSVPVVLPEVVGGMHWLSAEVR